MGTLVTAAVPGAGMAADGGTEHVPLCDDGILIRVPVQVYGKTRYFMLDTGCSLSSLDLRFKDRLGETVGQCRAATAVNSDSRLSVYQSPEMRLGGRSLDLEEVGCVDLSMARWVSGQRCDGVLGMDFLAHNIVSLDFDKKEAAFYGALPGEIAGGSTAIILKPLTPHWAVTVWLNDHHPVDLMIDTGDSSSLSLNEKDWESVFSGEDPHVTSSIIGTLGGQTARNQTALVEKMSLQNLSYRNLHASSILNPDLHSTLGLSFFRRHKVTFDFPDGLLYLAPASSYAAADKHDMSGLHLLRIGGQTVVHFVDEESPASKAGILPEDIILSVNSRAADELAMNAIRSLLESREGDKVCLGIRRGENRQTMTLVLERTL